VKPTQRGSVLYFWVHVLYTAERCDKGAGMLSDRICSCSFWLEAKTTSEKGGGAYVKPRPASSFAGSQGVGWLQLNACKTQLKGG
jgi:hypothetical protein